MFIKPDCIPCILNMSLGYLRKVSLSETRMTDIYTEILNMPPLKGQMWNITGPEVIEPIMDKIMTATNNTDPLSFEKEKQNELMMGLYPKLKHIVDASGNPLQTAAHIAILGNAIDIMLLNGTTDIQKIISDLHAYANSTCPDWAIDIVKSMAGLIEHILSQRDR